MPELPSAAPPVLARFATAPRTTPSPLWRGVRSAGITCIAATRDQCRAVVAVAQAGAPIPVDRDMAADRSRVRIMVDLTPAAGGRPAIALTIRPSIPIDDAQGEWIGPTVFGRDGEAFEALAGRALDQALPWRRARTTTSQGR